jgi:hypothetical protein
VSTDEPQHIALPQLYGAPAYARPPTVAEIAERPFDPDELPIEADQTEEEREFNMTLPVQAYAPGGVLLGRGTRTDAGVGEPLRPRSLSIRGIAGRLLGGN